MAPNLPMEKEPAPNKEVKGLQRSRTPRFLGGTGKHRELDNWSKEEVLRIRFEDILSQPEMKISEIAEFAGSSISPDMLEEMTSSLDPSRAFSHREDRELSKFAEQNAELLADFGY